MPLMNSSSLTIPQFFSPALSNSAVTTHASGLGMYDNTAGTLVTGVDDINQCIYIIITTPKGSDPHRPTFGCDADKYIDAPVNIAKPHLVREITDSLRQWEPRIIVERVLVTLSDIAQLNCAVAWRFADGVLSDNYVTNLSLGLARSV